MPNVKNMFSENTKKILRHLQANIGLEEDFKQIAAAVGLPDRTVNCAITSSLVKRGFAERVKVEDRDRPIIRLTEAGQKISPDEIITK